MNNTNESTRAIPILERPIIQRTSNSFVSVANGNVSNRDPLVLATFDSTIVRVPRPGTARLTT